VSAPQNAPTATAPDRLLTLGEIQTLASVSRGTVWRWRQEHGLPVIRVAGVCRVRESVFWEWLARHGESGAA